MIVVHGWHLFAHPAFLDQLDRLVAAVEADQAKTPSAADATANVKLLAALRKLVFETVPADPTWPDYRQGGTLGAARKHWFRAKFGGQRFRLFFRFDSRAKVIIYAWVNDSQTLRTYGSKTDAYAVFRGMLDDGHPPDDWAALLATATSLNIGRSPADPRRQNPRGRSRKG